MGDSRNMGRNGLAKQLLILLVWLAALSSVNGDCNVSESSVNKKILQCINVTISSDFPDGSTAVFHEIILKNVKLTTDEYLNVINEHQTETLKIIDSELSDGQLQRILRGKSYLRLHTLDVSGNKIQVLDRELFRRNVRLRSLNLARNEIRDIRGDVFTDLLDLNEIFLSENRIVNFNGGFEVFQTLKQLKILDLSNNLIDNIERNMFFGLESLVELHMSNNKLNILPYQVFEFLPSIEVVDLSHNLLVSFFDGFFRYNHKLKSLLLHNNLIGKIHKSALYELRELHTLDLSHNQLLTVDRNAFDTLDGLKLLHLNYNNIHLLSANVFLSLKQLETLDLSYNVLEELPLGIFAHQFSLQQLTMDNTQISKLDNFISKTSVIDKNVLKNLRVVSLRNSTGLRKVESSFLQNLPAIEKLSITRSLLTVLPSGIDEMPGLVELDLSDNRLEFIPQGIKHLTQLKSLNLLRNDFQCDCHMFWMLNWIDELEVKNKTLPSELLRLSELKCRNEYPGDVIRVLQHINCVKPYLISKTEDKTYQLFTDAVLECSFAGTPGPEIIWRTPYGEILRFDEEKVDKTAKFQLEQQHKSVLKDTDANVKYQEIIDTVMKEQTGEKVRHGPGITLLENGYLKVHNISRLDAGLYSCFAVNIMGNDEADVR